jgi:hypothetical protein
MTKISVSKVIQETKSWRDKEMLEAWERNVGIDKATEIRNQAKERGKKLDADFEQYTITGSCENIGLMKLLLDYKVKFRELPVEHEVAPGIILKGRIDALLEDYNNNSLIIDFKTASKTKKENLITDYFLQLGAYYYLLRMKDQCTPFKMARIVIFINDMFTPQVFRVNEKQLNGYAEQFIERLAQYLDMIKK